MSALTSSQVEQMVIQSNQQNPIEIVGYLVGKMPDSVGLLSRIERFNKKMAQNPQNRLPAFSKDESKAKSIDKTTLRHPSELKQEYPGKLVKQSQLSAEIGQRDLSPKKSVQLDKVKQRSFVN